MARGVSISVVCCVAAAATAQEGTVELIIDTRVLEVGEAVDVRLVCTDTGRPDTPQPAVPDGLDLTLLSPTPSELSSTRVINNQVTRWMEYTYQLRLTGNKTGTYNLGPITVEADGNEYRTQPVQIIVKEVVAAAGPRGDHYMFAELDVEPKSLYISESYTATLTIGMRKVEIGGQIYEMNLLGQVLDQRGSQLSIFPGSRPSSSEKWLTDASGRRNRYEIFQVTKTLRAEEVGQVRIGPIFLKANYPTAVQRGLGFFGRTRVTRSRKETARADAIFVEVKAPPEENRPGDFTGAIGRYRMKVSAKPRRVEQGKPVTLTVAISGRPLEGTAGPDLSKHAELASRFDYAKEELVGDIERGQKLFRRAIFPKLQGEQTIPPISWSYFDTRTERYVTLTSEPTAIMVDPPTGGTKTITLTDEPGAKDGTTLTVLTGGISPNYIEPSLALSNQTFALTTPWSTALIVPPLAWLVLTLTTRHRARLRDDVGLARRRRAQRDARTLLNHALSDGQTDRQWGNLAGALKSYLSNRFNMPPGELTPAEAKEILAKRGADDGTSREVAEFLDACNEARYAPGVFGAMSAEQAADNIRKWIKRIERTTR